MRLKQHLFKVGDVIITDKQNFSILEAFVSERISQGVLIRENAYIYACNICGYRGRKKESDLIRGKGCPCCNNKVVVEGINDIPTTAPWMVAYFQGGYNEAKLYARTSNKSIFPICPYCGQIKKKSVKIQNIYNKQSIGCSCNICGSSYPERFMSEVLNQSCYSKSYQTQFSPKWLNGRRFDFCIENVKLIIETDGRLGHGHEAWGGRREEALASLDNDKEKDKLAQQHGYRVIRVDCKYSTFDYIRNSIQSSELSEYIDLSKIDYSRCEKFALGNRVKTICEYWQTHQDLSCKEIGDIFNCGTYTVTRYLKRGHAIGWCDYTTEMGKQLGIARSNLYRTAHRRQSKYDSIPVYSVDKEGKHIYYNSISLAAKQTGVDKYHINYVCRHIRSYNTAGGFKWIYADEYKAAS